MVSTRMTHVFRHPKYYKELRANRQQATGNEPTGHGQRASKSPQATGPGRVGPKDSSGQASSGSRINKR